jgi:hypothetical protein
MNPFVTTLIEYIFQAILILFDSLGELRMEICCGLTSRGLEVRR